MASQPPPPGLPPDEIPRRAPWKAIAALVGAVGVAAAIVVFLSPKDEPPPPADPAPVEDPRPVRAPSVPAPARSTPAAAPSSSDIAAQKLFAQAEAVERSGDPEKSMQAWREVFTKHPGTSYARQAETRYRTANDALVASLERDFETARKGAASLASAGRYAAAIEALRAYQKEQPREALRQRADAEIASLENHSRAVFNEAVRAAQALTKEGKVDEAIALFEAPAKGGIPEVASRSAAALADLRKLAEESRKVSDAKQSEESRRALREKVAPKVLAAVRARRYEEALRELDQAGTDPAVAEERAAVLSAAQFWEAFLKAARAHASQETTVLLEGNRRLSGKLISVTAERITLEGPAGSAEAPLDKIHGDQVVAWTLGKTLPTGEGASYVKAALFFFCEGNDDVARLYFATALEKGADLTQPERVFRSGFLRAAATPAKK
jgi:hypothetical protein